MSRHRSTVLVTGAAGFIGRSVVTHLVGQGFRVRAMVRSLQTSRFSAAANLEVVQGDMCDRESLDAAVAGASAVVHLASKVADDKDSVDVNVGGARRLVESCRASGCDRLINMSTQSSKIQRKGLYAQTKYDAERVFHGAPLRVTSLLPSIVYGEELMGVFGTIVRSIRSLPVLPVLGDGSWLSAPLYVGDLSAAVVSSLEQDATVGRTYDVGGPDIVSFDDLVDRISARVGMRRPKLHVPFGLALVIARCGAAVLTRPPITVSNVLGSNQNTDIDIRPAERDFGFCPMSLSAGLDRVFSAVRRDLPSDYRTSDT